MELMFTGCEKFNKKLDNWDVSKVTNVSYMFAFCTNFRQKLKWKKYHIDLKNNQHMFYNAGISYKDAIGYDIIETPTDKEPIFTPIENQLLTPRKTPPSMPSPQISHNVTMRKTKRKKSPTTPKTPTPKTPSSKTPTPKTPSSKISTPKTPTPQNVTKRRRKN
jgi:surface protein